MFEQTFSLSDLPRVFVLVFLEWILSLDNAVVLALIAKRLPEHQQKKALTIGLFSTLVLRAIAIFLVVFLIQFFWIQLIGAFYLIYLSIRYFYKPPSKTPSFSSTSFWKTVLWIELTDLIFALDSILAGVAFVSSSMGPSHLFSKLWIIYVGAIMGLIGVRFTARKFTNLLNHFERLTACSHLLIGWIGIHLSLNSLVLSGWISQLPFFFEITFWMGIVLLFAIGFSKRSKDTV